MKRISSESIVSSAVLAALCGLGLALSLIYSGPVHAGEQPQGIKEAPADGSNAAGRAGYEADNSEVSSEDPLVTSRSTARTFRPAPVPGQIALHVKVLRIDEAKLSEAKIDLSDVIGGRGRHSAYEKPRAVAHEIRTGREFALLLGQLKSSGAGEVLAEPTIVTADGRDACLQIGRKVPILAVDETVNGERRTSIRHHHIGQILYVVAKLAGDNTIQLDISFEDNQVLPADEKGSEIGTPTLKSRKTESAVELRPGQTAILAERYATEDRDTDIEARRLLVALTPELVSPVDAADIPSPGSRASAGGEPVSNGEGSENVRQMDEDSTRGVQLNPLLADEIRNLVTKKNLLLDHYGSNHPKVMSLQSQLDSMRRRQADKLLAAMEREIQSETTEADALAQSESAEERLRSSQGPSPRSSNSGDRRAQRVDSGSILNELRSLREDVRTVRRDVNRLIELLEDRRGPQERSQQEDSSEPAPDTVTTVTRDFPGGPWDLTLREAITTALQNSKTVTVASAESTNGGPITIRRSNADMNLTDAKDAAAKVVTDVERAYWNLWLAYRNLDTTKEARDASLESWQGISSKEEGPDIVGEAKARKQYFLFRGKVEDALRAVYASECHLRFVLGLPSDDGRLIRPCEDPTVTKTSFDWTKLQAEALENRPELARQRWRLRQRELELTAAKAAVKPAISMSNAYQWTERQQFLPVGYRTQMAGIRNAQLLLAREQAALEDIELNAVHQLTGAVRNLDEAYVLAQTHSNRRKATEQEVEALTKRQSQAASPDALADAQNRRAATAIDYWKSLADFANALGDVHLKKGSLLNYRNIVVEDSSAAEREKDHRDAIE